MSKRRFGVEIECGLDHKRGTSDYPLPEIPSVDRNDSYAKRVQQHTRVRNAFRENAGKLGINPYWATNMGWDGTMAELRSPILQGPAGFKELHTVMNYLTELGGYVTNSDGMHIHIDAPEYVNDAKAVIRLVKTWHANKNLIFSFVAPRRRGGPACPAWDEAEIGRLAEYAEKGERIIPARRDSYYGTTPARKITDFKQDDWGRHDLNLRALSEHGSVEIRLHQGILDPVRAEAWIKLGQSLLDACVSRKTPVDTLATREELLKRLGTPKSATETLLKVKERARA